MLKNSSLNSNVSFSLVHYEQKNLIWKVKFCKLYQHFLLFQCIKYVFFVSCWVQKEWVSFLQWFTMGQESQNLLSSMNRVHRKKLSDRGRWSFKNTIFSNAILHIPKILICKTKSIPRHHGTGGALGQVPHLIQDLHLYFHYVNVKQCWLCHTFEKIYLLCFYLDAYCLYRYPRIKKGK